MVSGSYNRTDGHRTDMGFEQYGGYARLGYEMTDCWSLRGDVNVTHFNASYPGPADAPLLDGDQRITRGHGLTCPRESLRENIRSRQFFLQLGQSLD